MKKDVMITITGTQTVEGEVELIELTTAASLYNKGNALYIRYQETEITGFEGMTTTVKVEGDQRVTMIRHGASQTQLIIEKGRRHQCSYATGYGDVMLGITGSTIVNTLSQEGGELFFRYSIDLNTAVTSENSVKITMAAPICKS